MGNKEVGAASNGVTESYSIVSFPGSKLPDRYRAMVFSKWMRSLRYGNDYFKLWEANDYTDAEGQKHKGYFSTYQKYIEALLGRSNSVVRVAVLSDDHDVALGWSLIEGDVLHYVHVQRDYRNKKIGASLVPVQINIFSHITKNGMSIWASRGRHAKFDPGA